MRNKANSMDTLTYSTKDSHVIASPAQPAMIGTGNCLEDIPYISEFINYYFSTRCQCRPKVMSIAKALKASGCRIILATKEEAEVEGFKVSKMQHDGFTLRTEDDRAGNRLIICVGNNAQGIKYGLYRLIMESEYADQTLFLTGPLSIEVSPLFEKRVIIESPSSALDATWLNVKSLPGESPSSPLNYWKNDSTASKKYCPVWWTEAQNRDWVKMMDSFGFNTLELGFSNNSHSWAGATPDQAINSAKMRFQENKRLGNDNILFVWGAAIYLKENKSWNYRNCLSSAHGKKEARKYHNYLAGQFGSMADYVLTHWGDPGGCKLSDCACSVKTIQENHNQIVNAFKKYNQRLQSIFSIWAMGWRGTDFGWEWKSINGIEDIDMLEFGILANDVGIATQQLGHTLPQGIWLDYLKKIISNKRKVGMWVWYVFDFEINPGLHINYKRGAQYLKNLAETDYVKHIQWSQCDTCRQGDWNTVSTMVGGMLMLDVRLDPDSLVREFCAGIAGKENATKVKKALDAIHLTRNYLDPGAAQDNGQIIFGKGSDDPMRDYQLVDDSIKELENISVNEGRIPKIPYLELIFNFKTMMEDLKMNLAAIRDYNQARIKVLDLAKMKDTISEADLIKKLKDLDPRMLPRTYDIGIVPEVHRLNNWKTFVQKHLQRTPEGCPVS